MTEASFVLSTIALALYSIGYFFHQKKHYLICQLVGNIFLSLSYLMIGAYYTTVVVLIGIIQLFVCYAYEKKDKRVPTWFIVALCASSVSCYVIINNVILSQASVWDAVYLFASCMYAICFSIRNLRVVRYVVLIPHASAVAYNLLIHAPISSALAYGIEGVVTVVAIVKDEATRRKNKKVN